MERSRGHTSLSASLSGMTNLDNVPHGSFRLSGYFTGYRDYQIVPMEIPRPEPFQRVSPVRREKAPPRKVRIVWGRGDPKTAEEEERFTCPLTYQVMDRPVRTIYGHVFERGALEEWLSTRSTCPLTRHPLTSTDFKDDDELRKEIDKRVL